jgi:hypothetical protein
MAPTINISAPPFSINSINDSYHDEEGGLIQQEHEVTFGGRMTEGKKESPLYKGAAALGLLILAVVVVAGASSSSSIDSNNMVTSRPASPSTSHNKRYERNLLGDEKCSAINVDFQYIGEFSPLETCSGSPRLFEMVYHGGRCPASQAGTSLCSDFNSGPPPQGSKTEVYISITDVSSIDILYAGTRKSGQDFYIFNEWQTLPVQGKIEIYNNVSRAELLQVATIDMTCLDPNVIYKTVGASQITGFDTPSNGRVSVLSSRSPPAKVTVTISAESSTTNNDANQPSSSSYLKMTSLSVSNGVIGSPPK